MKFLVLALLIAVSGSAVRDVCNYAQMASSEFYQNVDCCCLITLNGITSECCAKVYECPSPAGIPGCPCNEN